MIFEGFMYYDVVSHVDERKVPNTQAPDRGSIPDGPRATDQLGARRDELQRTRAPRGRLAQSRTSPPSTSPTRARVRARATRVFSYLLSLLFLFIITSGSATYSKNIWVLLPNNNNTYCLCCTFVANDQLLRHGLNANRHATSSAVY